MQLRGSETLVVVDLQSKRLRSFLVLQAGTKVFCIQVDRATIDTGFVIDDDNDIVRILPKCRFGHAASKYQR